MKPAVVGQPTAEPVAIVHTTGPTGPGPGTYGSVEGGAVHQGNLVLVTVWEGTTWLNACPCWLACFTPLW